MFHFKAEADVGSHRQVVLFAQDVVKALSTLSTKVEPSSAAVFINDDESGLHQDYERWLEDLAPHEPVSQYPHNRTG